MLEYKVYDRINRLSNAIRNPGMDTRNQKSHLEVDKLLEKHRLY
jgi:hypothetical protein